MNYYVTIKHPITGENIVAVPTGKTDQNKAEVRVLTPETNLTTIWITKEELI